jgi:hypothetical protein
VDRRSAWRTFVPSTTKRSTPSRTRRSSGTGTPCRRAGWGPFELGSREAARLLRGARLRRVVRGARHGPALRAARRGPAPRAARHNPALRGARRGSAPTSPLR